MNDWLQRYWSTVCLISAVTLLSWSCADNAHFASSPGQQDDAEFSDALQSPHDTGWPEDVEPVEDVEDVAPDAQEPDAQEPESPEDPDVLDPPDDSEEPDEPDEPAEPDPPTGPLTRTYRILHWNVAGNKVNQARTNTGMIPELIRFIDSHNAHFVGLNEICRSQFDEIKARLERRGWPQNAQHFARFAASIPASGMPSRCGAFGNAIFSKLPLGTATRVELPSDGTRESRYLLCAPITTLNHLRFCTTHLTPKIADGHNRRQVNKVFQTLENYYERGDTVIVTGDFNTEPNAASMDAVYAPGVNTPNNRNNHGNYRELDDNDAAHCRGYGQATGQYASGGACGKGRKIDYIFVRANRVVWNADTPYTASARALNRNCGAGNNELCSDHRMLTGRVTVKINR